MSKFQSISLPTLSDSATMKEVENESRKMGLDILNKLNAVADAQYPVGYVYTQYPGTSDPATLFGGTWLNITSLYAGLFFRAEGGGSLAFNAGNQTDLVGPHSHTASSGGSGALGHTHSVPYPETRWGGSANNPGTYINGGPISPPPVFMTNSGTGYTGANGGTSGTNASIDHTHTITVNATTTAETRPVNTTIRIWQRTGGTLTSTTGTSIVTGIYDSGTNANGSWIRFTDGTMICRATVTNVAASTSQTNFYGTTAGTNYYSDQSYSLPQNFIDTTYTINTNINGAIGSSYVTGKSAGGYNFRFIYYVAFAIGALTADIIAIGKWK
jgi:hypothetical protein